MCSKNDEKTPLKFQNTSFPKYLLRETNYVREKYFLR